MCSGIRGPDFLGADGSTVRYCAGSQLRTREACCSIHYWRWSGCAPPSRRIMLASLLVARCFHVSHTPWTHYHLSGLGSHCHLQGDVSASRVACAASGKLASHAGTTKRLYRRDICLETLPVIFRSFVSSWTRGRKGCKTAMGISFLGGSGDLSGGWQGSRSLWLTPASHWRYRLSSWNHIHAWPSIGGSEHGSMMRTKERLTRGVLGCVLSGRLLAFVL